MSNVNFNLSDCGIAVLVWCIMKTHKGFGKQKANKTPTSSLGIPPTLRSDCFLICHEKLLDFSHHFLKTLSCDLMAVMKECVGTCVT